MTPPDDPIQSLRKLALQFSDLLAEIAKLHLLEAQTRAILLSLAEAPRPHAPELDATRDLARDCEATFDRIESLSLGCADLIERHGRLLFQTSARTARHDHGDGSAP